MYILARTGSEGTLNSLRSWFPPAIQEAFHSACSKSPVSKRAGALQSLSASFPSQIFTFQ